MNAATKLELPYEILCDTDDEPDWLSARYAGIGSSEIGAVIGMAGSYSSAFKLFLEKTGALEPEDLSDVEAIRWGHRLEPVIAEDYRERTGRRVTRGRRGKYCVLRSKEHPWALASLDFWTGDAANDGADWPLEVKNANAFRADDWVNGTPDYYIAQLHQQMLVCGTDRATSAVLIGGNKLAWCDVHRDETLIRKIVYQGALFWERVQQKNPPDPDGSDATRDALRRLYPESDGQAVVIPAQLEETIYEWRRLKLAESSNKKTLQKLEAAIKATLGSAERGIIMSTGDAISWASHRVEEHVVKAHTQRPLRFLESKRG